jgi:MFS family permease
MTERQFFWGLANGIIVLAIAGVFWFGMALGPYAAEAGWLLCTVVTLITYGSCGAIIWAAFRLRHKFGFKRSELRQSNDLQRMINRKIMISFRWIGIVQTLLVILAVFFCLYLEHKEFIWPLIGLIVSAHFVPLARVFHVRPYYYIGIAGSVISLLALLNFFGFRSLMYFGIEMGIIMWLSAVYILFHANRICAKAILEPWSD